MTEPAPEFLLGYTRVETLHGWHHVPLDERHDHTPCPFCDCAPERLPGRMEWRHHPLRPRPEEN